MSEKKGERKWKVKTYIEFVAVLLRRDDCHTVLTGVPCCEVLHDCLGVVLEGDIVD